MLSKFINRSSLYSIACFSTGGAVGTLFFERVIRITTVEGPSMEPVFQPQDTLLGISPEAWCFFQKIKSKFPFLLLNKSSSSSSSSGFDDEPCFNERIVVCEIRPGMNYCKVARICNHQNTNNNSSKNNNNNNKIDRLTILGVNSRQSMDSRELGDVPLCAVKSVVVCKISPKFVWLLGKKMEIH